MIKPLVVANWKLNPRTLKEAKTLFSGIKKNASRLKNIEAVVCPSFPHLIPLAQSYRGSKVKFGTQDIFYERSGPFTGEVSPDMLTDAGTDYVIVGHSERRDLGEKNELVAHKLHAGIRSEIKTILCVGERERDADGLFLSFIKEQIESALRGAPKRYVGNIIIAYEPLWAIGKTDNEAITPHDLHQMTLYIRKVVAGVLSRKTADETPILYGGSVERGNAQSLMEEGEVNGFLVGHASLEPNEFGAILKIVDKAVNKK